MQFHRPAGLNVYIRQQTVVEVPVNWPGILYDLDTPEDLARLCSLLADSEATFPTSSQ
jgi:CTP:molybdopterin cytidylyltransferase MocA